MGAGKARRLCKQRTVGQKHRRRPRLADHHEGDWSGLQGWHRIAISPAQRRVCESGDRLQTGEVRGDGRISSEESADRLWHHMGIAVSGESDLDDPLSVATAVRKDFFNAAFHSSVNPEILHS
jgi:hypothetical protein